MESNYSLLQELMAEATYLLKLFRKEDRIIQIFHCIKYKYKGNPTVMLSGKVTARAIGK
jgi:hypothetical protein